MFTSKSARWVFMRRWGAPERRRAVMSWGGGGGRIDGCWEGRGVLFITETGPGQTDGTGPPLPPAAAASPAPHPSRTGT